MPKYPSMRAINTKLATLSSTTRTVASLGMLGFLMGWVSRTLSDMCAPCKEALDFLDELINIEWLLNVAITTGFQGLFFITAHDIGRQSQDRNHGKTWNALTPRSERISVHVMHLYIHQDQVR